MGDGGSGIAHPGFPCTYFGWEFLSRMVWFPQAAGRPLSASMPNRAKPDLLVRFPLGIRILLRNSRRKRSTENPGQAIPLSPPPKKLPPVLGRVKRNIMIRHYIFLITSKSQEHTPPCPVCSCLPVLPLPASVQNLFQKMVVFLIVPKRWFMTVSGGVV